MHEYSWQGAVARRRGKDDVNWVRQTRASGRRTAINRLSPIREQELWLLSPNIEAPGTSARRVF